MGLHRRRQFRAFIQRGRQDQAAREAQRRLVNIMASSERTTATNVQVCVGGKVVYHG